MTEKGNRSCDLHPKVHQVLPWPDLDTHLGKLTSVIARAAADPGFMQSSGCKQTRSWGSRKDRKSAFSLQNKAEKLKMQLR
jgi:hypothetical protein